MYVRPPKTGMLPEEDLAAIGGAPYPNYDFIQGISPAGAQGTGGASGGSYNKFLTIPGTQPDFMGILNGDPLLQQFRSDNAAQGVSDRAGLTAARQRALVQFGLIPDLSNSLGIAGGDINEDITSETRALADTNTREGLSTVGRLNREFERVQQNIMDSLAARGALRSGATGIALNDLQQDRKVALSDAEQQLLDYLGGVQQAFTQSERQRQAALVEQQNSAAGRIDPSALAGGPTQAKHIGGGVYESPDGRLWNQDGTPYSGPDPRQQDQAGAQGAQPDYAALGLQAWQQQPTDPVPSRSPFNPIPGIFQQY